MSIINKILDSKARKDVTEIFKSVGGKTDKIEKYTRLVNPLIGTGEMYHRQMPNKKLVNPNKPNENIELVYDYYKNVKLGSVSSFLPGLDPYDLAKEILKRNGYNPDVVPIYKGETNSDNPVRDYMKDPAKALMKAYDFIRSKAKIDKVPEKVESTVKLYNPLEKKINVSKLPVMKPNIVPVGRSYPHFKGWDSVNGLELWSSHLWDIKMTPYIHEGKYCGIPSPPHINNYIPVTSFEFTDDYVSPFTVEMTSGSSFMIPETRNLTKSIRMSILDTIGSGSYLTGSFTTEGSNRVRTWKDYIRKYKDAMVDDFMVLPYKNACTAITLYMLDTDLKVMYENTYLCIPMNLDSSYSGSLPGTEELTLEWSIVGELTEE